MWQAAQLALKSFSPFTRSAACTGEPAMLKIKTIVASSTISDSLFKPFLLYLDFSIRAFLYLNIK
jgi:hypothetical protein